MNEERVKKAVLAEVVQLASFWEMGSSRAKSHSNWSGRAVLGRLDQSPSPGKGSIQGGSPLRIRRQGASSEDREEDRTRGGAGTVPRPWPARLQTLYGVR